MTDLRDQLQLSLGATYTIDRELGGGGMSRVLVAHDTALRRDIVIKVLPPELVAGVNVERFRREILVAAGLQHPHIVPVLAAGEMDGLPWFTMPFVDGESLRQRIARGPLPIGEAVSVLREVAKALAYAHERGVVHRDIKPDNVLLTGGTAMVTDFGIAKALSASRSDEPNATRGGSLTQIGTSIGTPMYMAPEQAAADPHTDARADIYSFGCMAYETLAGRPPFAGMSPQKLLAAHMGERPQPISDLRRDTPPLLGELVMRCLEKDPDNRPQSAADIVRLLDAATSTTSGSGAVASAVLLGGRVRLRVALGVWAVAFFAAWILAKAAIVGIGLPSWVLPGALVVAGLGLPVILFTAFVQRTAHKELLRTPTLTPGGTVAPQGTMATIAFKASPHVSWRRTVRGGVLAFSAFVLLIAGFMTLRALGIGPAGSLLAAGRITAKEPLLVTDFSVRNGDSTLAGVVTEAVRASLAQSSAITLVSPATVAAALQRMQRPSGSRLDLALARGMAQREGIKAIVDGDITQIGASGYAVSVRLVSADSGTTLATAQKVVDGPKELIAAADAIGRELRGRMGESLRSVQNAPPLDQVTTASIEALRLYSEGARAYDLSADGVTAAARLKQAVAIDSGFAMAWRKLGMVYVNSGYPLASIDSAVSQAYRFRERLSRSERLATTAAYFANGAGLDRARSAEALEQMLAAGDSDIAANNLGLIFETRRQYAKADSLFNAAVRTRKAQSGYVNLIANQSDMRQFARAEQSADKLAEQFASPAGRSYAFVIKATVMAAAGDLDRSEHLLDSLSVAAQGTSKSMALAGGAFIAAERGRATEVLSRLAGYRANDARNGVRGLPLNDSLTMSYYDVTSADQPARAVKRLDAALAATPLKTIAAPDRDYVSVATVYARAGRPDKAKAIMAQRSAEIRDTARLRNDAPFVHRVLGEIAIAEGRPRDAIREIWKGDSLPDGPADDCDACTDVNLARAYDKANMADSAISHFEKYFSSGFYLRSVAIDYAARAPAARRLGELYEAKGDRVKAAHYYQMFVDQWKRADPELQPQVAEIRKRLARLSNVER